MSGSNQTDVARQRQQAAAIGRCRVAWQRNEGGAVRIHLTDVPACRDLDQSFDGPGAETVFTDNSELGTVEFVDRVNTVDGQQLCPSWQAARTSCRERGHFLGDAKLIGQPQLAIADNGVD